jgi:hypothetical protein
MAIGRISGEMLVPNLLRGGVDLAVETDLLYFDVTNKRIGIKTTLIPASFLGSISGSILTVTPPVSGTIAVGMTLTGTGLAAGTRIVSGSGTSWVLSQIYTTPVTSVTITAVMAPNFGLVVADKTTITDTTQSISCSTGALVVDGGVGIAKNLNVCGDIFIAGKKIIPDPGAKPRKIYSFNIPALNVGDTFFHTATLGYSNIVYNLTVIAPVKVQVFTEPSYAESNPYTFVATVYHQTDDGTTYFTDGTILKTRQYSIFANLENPPTKKVYFKITGIADVFGGTPLSDLAPASFNGYIVGTDLFIVGGITGKLTSKMTFISGTSGVISGTQLVSFVGESWQISAPYTIGSAAAPIVMTARDYSSPGSKSVIFYGYISGTTMVVTSGLSTPLTANMRLSSSSSTAAIASTTTIVQLIGAIWKVSKSQTVGTSGATVAMTTQVLVNTLEMIYIDEASDAGSASVSVVSTLPLSGYTGETVYRSTDNTYWVFSGSIWNQI